MAVVADGDVLTFASTGYEFMSDSLQKDKIMEIRERKGMKLELPEGADYLD